MNWRELFIPQSLFEVFVRGTIMYFLIFLCFRVFKRRETGALNIADLLVVVLVAEASQNGMAGQHRSITEGAALIVTIMGWSHFLDWLGSRLPFFQRLLRPAPIALIRDGQLLRRAMREEMITVDELMAEVRKQGLDDMHCVKHAYLEADGTISIRPKTN